MALAAGYAGSNETIKALAEEVTAGQENEYDKAQAMVSYLKENYLYSLKPGLASDGNQLTHFLLQSRKGYCSYFAFSMALMARSLGMPARVAVGFLVDPSKEVLNFYEIRAYQAHAWVEIFFDDYGWIEFDPTSENLAPGENIEYIFSFDFENLASLIEEILDHQQQLTEEIPEETGWKGQIFRLGQVFRDGIGLLARLWYIILPLLYLIILIPLKTRAYLRFLLGRRPRERVKSLYHFSLSLLGSIGWAKAPQESPMDYADRQLHEHNLIYRDWTASYLKAVFGDTFTEADFHESVRLYRLFIDSYRSSISLWLRIAVFFNPLGSLRHKV